MSLQEMQEVINRDSLPMGVAQKYLKLYVADIDWVPHVTTLWNQSLKKNRNQEEAKNHIKKAISCATMLPYMEKTLIPDPPEQLLFWCTAWKQFSEKDWFLLLKDVIKKDIEILQNRNRLIQLGVIDPIDLSPMTRQAFNWLYQKADETLCLNESNTLDIKNKLTNVVRVYGGVTVCNLFINHKQNIDKVFNWRSGYFFEREIHKVYSIDQIEKIKSAEFSKINNKYIKKVGV